VPEQNQHCHVLFSSGGDFDNVLMGNGFDVMLVSLSISSHLSFVFVVVV
jgi:hypothetical protein